MTHGDIFDDLKKTGDIGHGILYDNNKGEGYVWEQNIIFVAILSPIAW